MSQPGAAAEPIITWRRPPRPPRTPLSTQITNQELELDRVRKRREAHFGTCLEVEHGQDSAMPAWKVGAAAYPTVEARLVALGLYLEEFRAPQKARRHPPKIERKTISSAISEDVLRRLYAKHASGDYGRTTRQSVQTRARAPHVPDGLDARALIGLLSELHVLVDMPAPDRDAAAARWMEELDIDGNGIIEWYELRRWWVGGGGAYTVNLGRLEAAAAADRLSTGRSQWLARTPTRPPRYPGLYYQGRLHQPIHGNELGVATPAQLYTPEQLARRPWSARAASGCAAHGQPHKSRAQELRGGDATPQTGPTTSRSQKLRRPESAKERALAGAAPDADTGAAAAVQGKPRRRPLSAVTASRTAPILDESN